MNFAEELLKRLLVVALTHSNQKDFVKVMMEYPTLLHTAHDNGIVNGAKQLLITGEGFKGVVSFGADDDKLKIVSLQLTSSSYAGMKSYGKSLADKYIVHFGTFQWHSRLLGMIYKLSIQNSSIKASFTWPNNFIVTN